MPYEDDYKMWLEEALIGMNPDWICDGMYDTEFTHDWCSKYCGEDDAYITPKCLHMFYHHIERADRKTESNSEKPNNSTISKMEQVENEPQTDWNETLPCHKCESALSSECTACDGQQYFRTEEGETDCSWK